ncbi:uncharacterized protein G2W53_011349 [Senna tora]|uniref:Uncharacterized protein n=1 Tax=Senna tora TaxID=362788 RepID=A0A835CD38_9FABA|nr:uncharacterized protein G2W53_011349 [Senna tora]
MGGSGLLGLDGVLGSLSSLGCSMQWFWGGRVCVRWVSITWPSMAVFDSG